MNPYIQMLYIYLPLNFIIINYIIYNSIILLIKCKGFDSAQI